MTQSAAPVRRRRQQAVLAVLETRRPDPHTVRLVVGGEGFAQFTDNPFTDKYVKIYFAPAGSALVPPYDLEELRGTVPAEDLPVTRTYTVRRVDVARQTLTIDFVVHGDAGLAAPWAASARAGDTVVLSGAGGKYRPDPTCDWHLFVGDESAVPAVSSAIEALPADAIGIAYLEVQPDAVLEVVPPAGVEVIRLDRTEPGSRPSLLAATVDAGRWPVGRVGVFAHGERESIKAIRAVLERRAIPNEQISISGYWAYGRTEDRFQAEKREPVGRTG